MSIPVAIDQLAAELTSRPWGYLVTVGPDLRAHLLAVPTDLRHDGFHVDAGRSSLANATARPEVTFVFPPPAADGYSLIVDGSAVVEGASLRVVPASAILHRPAIAGG